MKEGKPNRDRRKEDAHYWDSHDIGGAEDSEEVEVEVQFPLSAVLSIRIDPVHLDKLRLLARAQGIGMTTMARKILTKALDDPGEQLVLQTLSDASVQNAVAGILSESKTPPEGEETIYYLLSRESLEWIGELIKDTASRLWLEALHEKSVTVTPRQGELFDELRKLEGVNS